MHDPHHVARRSVALTRGDVAVILVVDDEEPLLKVLVRFLSGLGHDVRTATNGADALTLLQKGGVDLLVTDIHLPRIDGIEVLKTLHSSGRALPTIAMSGSGEADLSLLVGSAGWRAAIETLEKPFELDRLRAAIERVLS